MAFQLLDNHGKPEELEARLCKAYAPRDPIREFWQGKLTLRGLNALIGGLSAWSDREWLLWNVESRLRDRILQAHNAIDEHPISQDDISYLPNPDETGAEPEPEDTQSTMLLGRAAAIMFGG